MTSIEPAGVKAQVIDYLTLEAAWVFVCLFVFAVGHKVDRIIGDIISSSEQYTQIL